MLDRVKLVTLETCQMYGMRGIFVIASSPGMGTWGSRHPWPLHRDREAHLGRLERLSGQLLVRSYLLHIRLVVVEALWVR